MRSLFAAILFALTAAACQSTTVATPPSQAAAEMAGLRFDGLYWSPSRAPDGSISYRYYLRFYPDGHVSAVSSTGTPEDVGEWLTRKDSSFGQGKYQFGSGKLSFTSTTRMGSVDYSGTISRDRLDMHVVSRINGHVSDERFSFTPLTTMPP